MIDFENKKNLCNNCPPSIRGVCCYSMIFLNGGVFTLTNHPCQYLNTKTGRCKIYKKRREIHPNCLTLEEMYFVGSLPKECPYVKNDLEYQERDDIRTSPLLNKPPFLEEYNEYNLKPHKEIITYETLRSFICPKCKSEVLLEEWDDKFSILFFKYECELCGHKWNNLKKQIQFTLKLLKERRNNMQINRKVRKSEVL